MSTLEESKDVDMVDAPTAAAAVEVRFNFGKSCFCIYQSIYIYTLFGKKMLAFVIF